MRIKQPLRGAYSVLFLFSGTFVESSGPFARFNVPFDLFKLEEDEDALFVFDGVGLDSNVPVPGGSVVADVKEDTGIGVDGATWRRLRLTVLLLELPPMEPSGKPLPADLRLSSPLPEELTSAGAAEALVIVPSGRVGGEVAKELIKPRTGLLDNNVVLPNTTGLGGIVNGVP
ncbi:hypothetical protein GB937_000117 [Aspergillus fischeri]|nr:hypothetical protein GB937_000117 [Aspergillus fischeri]